MLFCDTKQTGQNITLSLWIFFTKVSERIKTTVIGFIHFNISGYSLDIVRDIKAKCSNVFFRFDFYCINQCYVWYYNYTAEQRDHSFYWSMLTQWMLETAALSVCFHIWTRTFTFVTLSIMWCPSLIDGQPLFYSSGKQEPDLLMKQEKHTERDRGRCEEGEYVRYNWCKWAIQFQWCHSVQTLSTLRWCCMLVLRCSCICCFHFPTVIKKKEICFRFCLTLHSLITRWDEIIRTKITFLISQHFPTIPGTFFFFFLQKL